VREGQTVEDAVGGVVGDHDLVARDEPQRLERSREGFAVGTAPCERDDDGDRPAHA
jgi:hypothetical protein